MPTRLPLALVLVVVAAWPGQTRADKLIYEPGYDPAVGFNLISWFNFGASGETTWQNAVQNLHIAGFDEVSISPVRFIDVGTGAIATTSNRGPELSHIAAGIARGKSLGMHVTVNPFVEPENFAFWRGQYDPTPGSGEWNTFWDDYEDYLVDVAQVAEAHGADALNVGTELRAITRNSGNNAKWASVISAVDAVFSGELGYAANWDNYTNGNLTSTIWDNPAIDYLGIDSYFRNTTTNSQSDASGTDPNETFIAQVEAGWTDRLENEILDFAAGVQSGAGLPVVLTEVGYLPYNRTTVTPQNSNGAVDSDEQVMAFRGLMRAMDGRSDELRAAHIWQWWMPGSNGSLWNIDPVLPVDQPNNLDLALWLSAFVSNPGVPGDFNGDGVVDAADYTIWRDGLGSTYTTADFDLWVEFFGQSLAASADGATVPEPGAWLLATLVAIGVSLKRRR